MNAIHDYVWGDVNCCGHAMDTESNVIHFPGCRPTAREALAQQLAEGYRLSRIQAREDRRERRERRRQARRARLWPWLIGAVVLGCFVIGLWGSTP